nr:LysR substrate-binding domain-containing protein [Rhizobium sp. ARZ01]
MPRHLPSRPDSAVLLGLDSSLLRSLSAVAETGSFVGGARIMHRTPSAISMQMKKLETLIGQSIFAHQGRSVVLTPAGEALLTYARRVLGIADEAMMRFNSLSQRSIVRMGMTDEYAVAFLPSLLANFAATHPLVEIDVTCRLSTVLSQMLDNGELDVALVTADSTGRAGPPGGGIYRDRLAWAGTVHGTAHLRRPLPIAVGTPSCMWRKAAIDALDAAGISYRITCTSENYAGQLAPVLADLAVAPLPCAVLPAGLLPLGPEDGLPSIGYFEIALRRSHHAPDELMSAVIDHVGAYFQARQIT